MAPPDHITGTNQSEGGITPPFTSSPMSLPSTFESQASQGQSPYQQQQAVQYQLSGSNNNNGGVAHEPEYQRQAKRSRGLEEEDDFVFGLDVGMDHDNIEGQDGKDPKSKPCVGRLCLAKFLSLMPYICSADLALVQDVKV